MKIPSKTSAAKNPRPLSVSLSRYKSIIAVCSALVAGATGVKAGTFYWDPDLIPGNNDISGAGLGGAGNWDTSSPEFWAPFSGTDAAWPNGTNTAIFNGIAGAVNLNAAVNAGELLFNTNGYSINPGTATTLTLSGPTTSPGVITLGSNVASAVSTVVIAGSNGLTFNGNGSGTLTLSGVDTLSGTVTLNSGQILVGGSTAALANSAVLGGATTNVTFGGTSTFRIDMNNGTVDRTINYGALTFAGGEGTVTSARAANNLFLNFTSLGTRGVGATGSFVNNGSTIGTGGNNAITIAGVSQGVMGAGYFAAPASAGVYNYAVYDTSLNSVRAVNYGGDANTATGGTGATLATASNVQATGSITAQTTGVFNTIDLFGASNLALTSGATVTTSGILKNNGGGSVTISGGTGLTAGGGGELVVRTDTAANDNITLATPILSSTGAVTKSGAGTLTLQGTQSYTGATYVNAGALVAQGPAALGTGSTIHLAGGVALNASSATVLSLQADGNGIGSLESVPFGKDLTVVGLANVTVGRLAAAQAVNKTIQLGALTLGEDTLSVTNNNGYALQFTGNVSMTGATNSTFNTATAAAPNVVQSLLLSGVVSSVNPNVGLTKQGAGTLVLDNASNNFGGAGALVDIQAGVLQANNEGSLGNTLNTITLDGGTLRVNYSNGASPSTRNLYLGASSNIEVTPGNTFVLANPLTVPVAGNNLTKNNNGTLVLGAANSGWAGVLAINTGIVRVQNSNSLPTGGANVAPANGPVAALQLDGGVGGLSIAVPLALGGTTVAATGINSGGTVENYTGNNTVSGTITINFDASVGADPGSTLNLTGPLVTNGHLLNIYGGGTVNANFSSIGAVPLFSLSKFGPGTTNWTVTTSTSSNGPSLHGGVFDLGASAVFTPAVGFSADTNSTLKVDNSGAAVSNRLGGSTKTLTLSASTLEYVVNSTTGSSESVGTLASAWGGNTIQVDPSGQTASLTFASLNANVVSGGSTLTFKSGSNGLGTAFGTALASPNNVFFTAAPTLSSPGIGIIPRALVIDANGFNFATYNNNGLVTNAFGIQALTNYNIPTISSTTIVGNTVTVADTSVLSVGQAVYGPGVPAGDTISSITNSTTYVLTTPATAAATVNLAYGSTPDTNINAFDSLRSAGENIKVGSGFINNGNAINSATRTLGSVNLFGPGAILDSSSSGVAGTGGSSTITLGSGNLLSQGAGTNTIGSGLIIASGGIELGLNVITGNTLQVNGVFTNASNVTKGRDGNVVFGAKQYFNTGNNVFTINGAGTVTLAGGNHTLFPGVQGGAAGQAVAVGPGSTLNLNGTTQLVGTLNDPNNTALPGGGGLVTSLTGAATLFDAGSVAGFWGGQITGNTSFGKGGAQALNLYSDNTYTGSTLVNGGQVILRDSGKLSGTSSIGINFSTLTVFNDGLNDDPNRLPDGAPISLNGGTLAFKGRSGFLSTEAVGPVTLASGTSILSSSNGSNSVPLSEAALTLASFTRNAAAGATAGFAQIYNQPGNTSTGNLGTIGTTERIVVTAGIPNVNNIIGGWSAVAYYFNSTPVEFGSYNPSFGVGALNTSGLPGYDGTTIPVTNQPTQNIRLSAGGGAVSAGGSVLNSLNLASNQTTAAALTFGAAGDTLNLTSGGLMVQNVFGTAGATTIGTSLIPGVITAGGLTPGANSDLFLYYYSNGNSALTINSKIADNTNGGGSAVRFIPWGGIWGSASPIILANNGNSYTGGTIVNQETLQIGATGTPGNLPAGGLTINGGVVTQNNGTIAPQVVTLNGSSTLTLVGANSLNNLVFNNIGGTTNPSVVTGGILSLTNGTPISVASTSNASTVPTVSGTLDFGGVAKTIFVDPATFNAQSVAPLTAQLNISALIQNSGQISKTGAGNLQLSSTTSTFTGGINLTSGGLIINGNSTPNTVGGSVTTGPLGTGTLTTGAGTTLLAAAASTVGNAVTIQGALTFDGLNNLTLNGATALSNVGNTAIAVNAPQMTATLGGVITGSGMGLTKNGYGNLVLGGNNTFSGGVTLNAGTLTGAGFNGLSASPFGTGNITYNGGLLALKNNGGSGFSTINLGNNFNISPSLALANIDVNNNGANTGNTFLLGNLGIAGGQTLDISGGNGYKLQFAGLTSIPATPTNFNPAAGLTVILPGGFSDSNRPVNVGQGAMVFTGNNSFTTPTTVTSTLMVSPGAGQTSSPLGSGGITLNNGATLQISPVYAGPLNTSGYNSGGLTSKYFFAGQTAMASAANFGIAPNSTLQGVQPNDGLFRQAPVGVNAGALTTSLALYQGLLNITTGGTYFFGGGSDDQLQIVVDGQIVQQDIGGGHALNQIALQSVALGAGAHQITVRAFNNGGGGGLQVLYSGPDTASNGITGTNPVNNLQALPLSQLSYAANYTSANSYQNAGILNNALSVVAGGSATVDGLGTDFNSAVTSLTLGNGSTLVTANGTGAVGSFGNGAFVVTGTTTLGSASTLSQTTGTLVLAGGISDGGLGLAKTGPGTLILGASSAFTGALNINGGFVQLGDGAGLTTGTTTIGVPTTTPATLDLNGQAVSTTGDIIVTGGAGPVGKSSNAGAGLYNSSAIAASLPNGGTLSVGAATAGKNASIGGFGDIVLNGVIRDNVAGSALDKVGPDTLVLNGANTFTGQLNIVGGLVQLGNAAALGATAGGTVISSGAALDLNGQTVTLAEPITINGTGANPNPTSNGITNLGAPNSLGVVFNSSASAASFAGPITVGNTGGFPFTFTVGGSSLLPNVAGDLTLAGVISGSAGLTKVGANSLNLTALNTYTGATTVNMGTVQLTGPTGGFSNASDSPVTVNSGTTLNLNNVAAELDNRLGGAATLTLNGNLNVLGNAGGTTELISTATKTISFASGASVITLQPDPNGAILFGVSSNQALARTAGATSLFRGPNLGTSGGSQSTNASGVTVGTGGGATFTNGPTFVFGAATGAIGQNGGSSSPNRAILPWALVDSSATGTGTSFATYSNTSGYTALIPSTESVSSFFILGIPVTSIPNVIGNPGTAPTGTLNINSLTLGNAALSGPAASAAVNAGSTLLLDSGGLLAFGNVSPAGGITGNGLLSTNSTNRELIVHTVVAPPTVANPNPTTTLFIKPQIYTTGGLTKADAGTLVLQSAELYTGATTVNGGTLQLAGGNNTLFSVFSTAPAVGATAAAVSGQALFVNSGATLDLNGNNQAVGVLNESNATQLQGGTIVNSNLATPATLHIAPNNNFTWSGNMQAGAGLLNFVRDGNNTFTVNSPNTLAGSATFTGGATRLIDLGTFENSPSINVTRASLIWDDTGVQAVATRLSSSATITLTGGGLQFDGRAGTGNTPMDAISLGTLNLGVGESSIAPSVVNQGGALQISFGGIGTRASGATLNFTGGSFVVGDNPRVVFNSAPTLSNGIIGGWATVTGLNSILVGGGGNAAFATYDPASGVRGLQYPPAGVFGAGVNTLINANTTLPAGNNTVNSLTMNTAVATLSFVNPADTLTIQSGGIISGTDANNRQIGASIAVSGQLVSGPGAGNDLYVHIGANTLTIDSKIIDNGSSNNLVVDGLSTAVGGTVVLANNNTYGGTTYVSGATLNLNSSQGLAIPHDLVLSGGNNAAADSLAFSSSTVLLSQPNQIASTAAVTMNGASQLSLNGFNNTIGSLTINNDGGSNSGNGPTVNTGTGVLTITGALTATNLSETFTIPTISGFLNFASGGGSIVVDQNLYAPGQIGLALNANLSGAPIIKSGLGVLGIGGQSSNYTSSITVNGGALAFSAANALVGSPIFLNGATLDTRGLTGTVGALNGDAASVVTNYIQGTAGTLVTGLAGATATFNGTFNEPFSAAALNLSKIGAGNLILTGNSILANPSSPNLGTLTANGGQLTISGAGRVGFTTYTLNAGSVLNLDNTGTNVNDRLGGSFQMPSASVANTITARAFNLQGGSLNLTAAPAGSLLEDLGNVTIANGASTITVLPGSGGSNVLNLNTVGNIFNSGALGGTLLVRGAGLGGTPGPGVATVTVNGAVPYNSTGAIFQLLPVTPVLPAAAGSPFLSIRPDIIGDIDPNGSGTGFVTYGASGLRLLSGTEIPATPSALGALLPTTTTNLSTTVAVASTTGLSIGETVSGTGIPANAFITGITDGTHFTLNAAATATALVTGTFGSGGANYASNQSSTFNTPTTVNSLVLNGGNSISSTTAGLSENYSAFGLMNTLTVNSGGLLVPASPSAATISGGTLLPGSLNQLILNTVGDLVLNSSIVPAGGQGVTKSGGGTLTISQPAFYTTLTTINAGTVALASGQANTIMVAPSAASPTTIDLRLNGGTLDLFGQNQAIGSLSSVNILPGQGGTVTNSSATPAIFTSNPGANTTFGGAIGGALQFNKDASSALTLTSPSSYNGPTNVLGGTLTLRDSGALTGTSALNINYATLTQDNTGLSDSTARLPAGAPINLSGGTLSTLVRQNNTDSQVLGPVTLAQGASAINQTLFNSTTTGSYSQTFASLTRSANTTVNFTNSGGQFGSTAPTNVGANPAIFFAANPTLTNNLIGGWAVINGTNFASYLPGRGIGEIGNTGAGFANYDLGNDVTFANAVQTAAMTNAVVNDGGTRALTVDRAVYALRVAPNAAATLTLGAAGVPHSLTLGSGGLLTNNNNSYVIAAGDPGSTLTSGVGELDAFINQNTTTIGAKIVNGASVVTLVKSGGGTLSLTAVNTYTGGTVINQGVVALNAPAGSAAIPGDVIINGGTLTMSNQGGQINAASNVTVNGAGAVNLTGANYLSTLNFNSNGGTLSNIVTLNAQSVNVSYTSGTTTVTLPSVAGVVVGQSVTGTNIPANDTVTGISGNNVTLLSPASGAGTALNFGGFLSISSANAVVAANDNLASTPTLTNGVLDLSGSPIVGRTITVNAGQAPIGFRISSVIQATDATMLVKAGAGGLSLTATNTFSGGVKVNDGTLVVDNTNAVGTNAAPLIIGDPNTGPASGSITIYSGTGTRTLQNPVTVNQNFTIGGTTAANSLVLSGSIQFRSGFTPTITVSNPATGFSSNGTITGTITASGSGGLIKAGPGLLTLSPGGTNSVPGGFFVNAGVLKTTTAGAVPAGSAMTVGTGAVYDTGGVSPVLLNLAGGGLVTNSGAAATLFVGGTTAADVTTDVNNFNFSGAITNGASSLGLTLAGRGTLILGGSGSNYSGATTLKNGVLRAGAPNAFSPFSSVVVGNSGLGSAATQGVLDLGGYSQSLGSYSLATDTGNTPALLTITGGNTLTVNGGFGVGFNTGSVITNTATTSLTVNGGGALVVGNPTAIFGVGAVGQGAQLNTNTTNLLDLTGLSSVVIGSSAMPISQLQIAEGQSNTGTLLLSNTANTITASSIQVGNSTGAVGGPGQLTLGTGTNVINADTINIGLSKVNGSINFALNSGPGTVTIGNEAGTGGADLNVGWQSGTNTAGVILGTLDLRGHNSLITARNVLVGNTDNSGGTGSASGVISFDTGTFSATSLTLGLKSGNVATATGSGTGTLNLGGGTFTVSGATTLANNSFSAAVTGGTTGTLNITSGAFTTGSLAVALKTGIGTGAATGGINLSGGSLTVAPAGSFVLATNSGGAGTSAATVNVTGGTLTSNADILMGGGSGTSGSISLNGGILDLTNHVIGSAATPVTTTFAAGILKNLAQINGGGGLVKTTTGTLTLDGANTYGGGTNISAGTLRVAITGSLIGSGSSTVANTATAQIDGTFGGGSLLQVAAGGTLAGGGLDNESTTIAGGGTLAPGTPTAPKNGVLTIGNNSTLTLGGASATTYLYDGVASGAGNTNTTASDQVVIAAGSNLSLLSPVTLKLSDAGVPPSNGIAVNFILFNGDPSSTPLNGGRAGTWVVNYGTTGWRGGAVTFDAANNDIVLTGVIVPEPAPVTFVLGGIGVLLGLQRFRRRNQS